MVAEGKERLGEGHRGRDGKKRKAWRAKGWRNNALVVRG